MTRSDGLSDDIQIKNIGIDTPNNLHILPGIFSINPISIPGPHAVGYGANSSLPHSYVKDTIQDSIGKLSTGGTDLEAGSKANFAIFSSHSPHGLTVSTDAIKNGV